VRAIGASVVALGVAAGLASCSLLLSYDDYDRAWDAADAGDAASGDGPSADGAPDASACSAPVTPACDADLQASADHCGACGHRCLPATAKCVASVCDVELAFAFPFVSPQGVAVDDEYFYGVAKISGATDGGAARVPKDNPLGVSTIAVYTQGPRRVVAHGLDVFWTEERGIARSPNGPLPDGGPNAAEVIVSGQPAAFAIAADEAHVYWTNSPAGGDVWRASIASPSDAEAIAPPQDAYGVAVDADYVYWTSSVQGGAVWRANKDGTGAVKIAADQSYPSGLAVDGEAIYWTNKSLSGSVMRRRKAGFAAPEVLARSRSRPDAIAVRGGYVYWSEAGSSQEDILRVPACGGAPLRLAVQQTVLDLAVDDTHVYWATGNAVSRVAR